MSKEQIKSAKNSVMAMQVSVTILRLDKKVSWTLLPEQQYMEVNLPFDPNQPNLDIEYKWKRLAVRPSMDTPAR